MNEKNQEQENQQEQMMKQAKQYTKKAFSGLDDIAKGTGQVAGGIGKVGLDLTRAAGDVAKAPGTVVEAVSSGIGDVVKAPGTMMQRGASNFEKGTEVIGNVLNKPGDMIQDYGDKVSKAYNKTGEILGDKTESLLGKGAGDIVRGTSNVLGGATKVLHDVTGKVLKAPGNLVKGIGDLTKGVGDFAGTILKAPGELIKGTGRLAGGILKAPGEILKGIANGVENIVYNTDKSKNVSLTQVKPNVQTTEQLINKLKAGDSRWLDGNQLEKLDNFAENMDKLSNGKLEKNAPFSNILTLPKEQRAEAVKEATMNLKENLRQIQIDLVNSPDRFTKQQRAELGLIMKGIDMQGGLDKFMSQHYGLTEKITQNPDFQLSGSEKKQAQSRYNNLAKATGLPTTDELAKRDAAMKNKNFDLNKDGKVTAQEARFGVAFDANKDGKVSILEKLEGTGYGNILPRSAAKTKEMNERLSEAGFGRIKKDGYNTLGGNTFKEQDAMEKLSGDSKDKKGALSNIIDATKRGVANKSNPLANPLANPSAKSMDKDVKPIISGNQVPNVSAPQKGLNVGGR